MSKLKYFDGTNWNIVNGQIVGDTLPIGSIIPYGSTVAPTGWLVCDGSAVNRNTYSELFATLGTSYGAGDGTTTFNLPNLKGRVPVGYNSADTDFDFIGEYGGEKKHQLTYNELPSQTLTGYCADNSKSWSTGHWGDNSSVAYATNTVSGSGHGTGEQPHNNLQPYQVVCYIIKVKQVAGLVGNVSNVQSNSTTDTYSCDYINGAIDGVVEQGRNANGDYIKFANGMLICSSYFGPVETLAGQGAQKVVNFPSEFVNDQYSCNISIITGQAYWADIAYCVNGKTKYGFTLQTWNRGGSINTGQWFNYIAIGRWK